MKKIIFIDIDGTLVDQRDGKEIIPQSAIESIKETRKQGNYVFLCTGRSKPEIFQFIIDVGIDGIIGAGGCYIEVFEKVIFHEMLPNEIVNKIVSYFNENNFDYYLEANNGLYGSKNLIKRLQKLIYGDYDSEPIAKERLIKNENPFIQKIESNNEISLENINKICFLENPNIPFQTIVQLFSNDVTIHHCTVPMFGHDSGEFSLKDFHKANAIDIVLKYLSIKKENTVAFGDGLNDIEMFEYCNLSIAMGNAKKQLKEVADDITDNVENNGIYNAMKKHSLI